MWTERERENRGRVEILLQSNPLTLQSFCSLAPLWSHKTNPSSPLFPTELRNPWSQFLQAEDELWIFEMQVITKSCRYFGDRDRTSCFSTSWHILKCYHLKAARRSHLGLSGINTHILRLTKQFNGVRTKLTFWNESTDICFACCIFIKIPIQLYANNRVETGGWRICF